MRLGGVFMMPNANPEKRNQQARVLAPSMGRDICVQRCNQWAAQQSLQVVLRNKWLWLKQQINVSKTAAPKKLIIHSGSLGTGQIDLKSAILVIRQNS